MEINTGHNKFKDLPLELVRNYPSNPPNPPPPHPKQLVFYFCYIEKLLIGERLDLLWGDIPYLRLCYVSRLLFYGMLQKVILADDVAKEATIEEDMA